MLEIFQKLFNFDNKSTSKCKLSRKIYLAQMGSVLQKWSTKTKHTNFEQLRFACVTFI